MESAKFAVIPSQVSTPRTDVEQSSVVSDYTQMDQTLKEEGNYIPGMVKKIKGTDLVAILLE